jgi:single-stranded-DNA-specific exonuclease
MTHQIYQSILKKNYQKSLIDERLALTIHQQFGLDPATARVLGARVLGARVLATKSQNDNLSSKNLSSGNFNFDEIENFLNPTIKNSLPDPFTLLDMDLAVTKIISSIKAKNKITIFGDYDVDGATSSALLKRFFSSIGAKVDIYIPDRILEGYGPNIEALLNLKKQGTSLVITVDCGTVAFEALEAAHQAGLEVIVIDHHIGAFEKPRAIAVINPNRLDENFPHKNLAAVGVSFLLAVAINKVLREEDFFSDKNFAEPNLMNLLDLVALGTVCDVMVLDKVNRAFVAVGLKIMKNRSNIGIRALCDIANLDEEPTSYHLGFLVGPRINAGGRVGRSDLGARLLSTNNEEEAKQIAVQLSEYNNQRKDIEAKILEEAENYFKPIADEHPVLMASSENWHQGVVGIVASRIKDLYGKPTAIIAIKDGIGKASCRSISGVDFGAAIIKAKLGGLLIEGGGHKMAAGFSIAVDKIPQLQKFLDDELSSAVEAASQNKIIQIADVLDINSANLNLVQNLLKLEPFGVGNAKPRFLIKDLQIVEAKIVGANEKHIRCVFAAKTLAGWNGRLVGFAFNAMNSDLGEVLISKNKSKPIAVIGQININRWMGNENLQLVVEDLVTQ